MTAPFATPFNWRPMGPTKVISGSTLYSPSAGTYAFVNARCWDGTSIVIAKTEMGQKTTGTWLKSEKPSYNVFKNVIRSGSYAKTHYQVPANRYFEGFIFNAYSIYHLYFNFDAINGASNLNRSNNYSYIIRGTNYNAASSGEIRENANRVDLKLGPGQEIYLLAGINTSNSSVHNSVAKHMGIIGVDRAISGAEVADGWTFVDERTEIYALNYRGVKASTAKWTASVVEYRVQS